MHEMPAQIGLPVVQTLPFEFLIQCFEEGWGL